MTDRELRRLSRKDLLEMLVDYSERVEGLEEKLSVAEKTIEEQQRVIQKNDSLLEELEDFRIQTDELQSKLEEAEEQLKAREISIQNSGSIAEASLKINGVFEASQRAADQYLENVKAKMMQTDSMCRQREMECQANLARMQLETEAKCAAREQQAKIEADKYWQEASTKLQAMIESNAFLQKMFEMMYAGKINEKT